MHGFHSGRGTPMGEKRALAYWPTPPWLRAIVCLQEQCVYRDVLACSLTQRQRVVCARVMPDSCGVPASSKSTVVPSHGAMCGFDGEKDSDCSSSDVDGTRSAPVAVALAAAGARQWPNKSEVLA
eukprot:4437763-Pleurochrysis_carterae.AAC.2